MLRRQPPELAVAIIFTLNGTGVLAQPWLAYRAIQVFQHRYARSLFTSQLDLPRPSENSWRYSRMVQLSAMSASAICRAVLSIVANGSVSS
jgi:hypothetical protein